MSVSAVLGRVYRCPVCGAEITVLSRRLGDFSPRCCNTAMLLLHRRADFYVCQRCGAELAVIRRGKGVFRAKCCTAEMVGKG